VPDAGADQLALAVRLESRALPREADFVYSRAIMLATPEEKPLFRWLYADFLVRDGQPEAAVAQLRAAVRDGPENPELHLTLAQLLSRHKSPGALDEYRTAVRMAEAWAQKPGHDAIPFRVTTPSVRTLVAERLEGNEPVGVTRYRRRLAQYLAERKLWDQALREWDAVLAEDARDALAHFSRGLTLEALGARPQARDAWARAVALAPDSTSFRLRLAQSLWEAGDYYEAANEWRAITVRDPGNIEARASLARAYFLMGEPAKAFSERREILRLAPDDRQAQR